MELAGDQALAKLGVHRIAVPIPFVQAGGPVNVIAVEEEGGGIALFDSGLGTAEGEAALVAGLAARGWSYADVRRLVLTHGHVDHYGLAQKIREASGAPVFVHPLDREKVAEPPHWPAQRDRYAAFLERCGAPPAAIEAMMRFGASGEKVAGRVKDPIEPLYDGMRLRFARCEGEVIETPGHTPGLVCVLLDGRVLIADDHLLEKVSPNPVLEIFPDGQRFRALPTYFRSLARVRALELDWVIPGHGPCFSDHRAVIDSLVGFYGQRQEKVIAAIPPEGATPVELVFAIFPKATPLDLYLMIGEILGNLDLLEDAGRVQWSEEGGRIRYRAR